MPGSNSSVWYRSDGANFSSTIKDLDSVTVNGHEKILKPALKKDFKIFHDTMMIQDKDNSLFRKLYVKTNLIEES